jgi:hypothetical protein
MAAGEPKETKKRDPDTAPANQLIDAVLVALRAGVPYEKVISSLEFARAADGYKAPVWRAAADAMTKAAAAMPPQNVAQRRAPEVPAS